MSNLILSRSVDESFVIRCGAVEIVITVLEVRRRYKDEVRISIEAPLSVRIVRTELLEQKETKKE